MCQRVILRDAMTGFADDEHYLPFVIQLVGLRRTPRGCPCPVKESMCA